MKTERQKKRETRHKSVIRLYGELSKEEGSRMAMWAEMERRTGYTREGMQKVLRRYGVDYTRRKEATP